MRDKVSRRCPQTTTFEKKGELKQIQTEVPPLTSLTPYRQAKPAHGQEMEEDGDYIYLSLHCHHKKDWCIKTGSDESRYSVSLLVRDKVTRQCAQTRTFLLKCEESQSRIELRSFFLPAQCLTTRPSGLTLLVDRCHNL